MKGDSNHGTIGNRGKSARTVDTRKYDESGHEARKRRKKLGAVRVQGRKKRTQPYQGIGRLRNLAGRAEGLRAGK